LAGTNEETYLALYAAGVFILLSMTGWAAAKRLIRELRIEFALSHLLVLVGTVLAATITSAATVVIFEERFLDGAWMYFVFIPILYAGFTYVRNRMGAPSPAMERLGDLETTMQPGFGFGQSIETPALSFATANVAVGNPASPQATSFNSVQADQMEVSPPGHILVPLDGTQFGEQALPAAEMLSKAYNANITLATVLSEPRFKLPIGNPEAQEKSVKEYLQKTAEKLQASGVTTDYTTLTGDSVAESLNDYAIEHDIDMLVISTHGRSGIGRWFYGSIANRIIQLILRPVLIMRPHREGTPPPPEFKRLLVTLDGSEFAERVLPWVRASTRLGSRVLLLSVPEVPEARRFGGIVDEIQELRQEAEDRACSYLAGVAKVLEEDGISTRLIVEGSRPAKTIVRIAKEEQVDVILLATHGRGGLDRLFMGSVADRVVRSSRCPVFLVPIHERRSRVNNNNNK
jgi:nucleotide-binding universal stress UspA family protein